MASLVTTNHTVITDLFQEVALPRCCCGYILSSLLNPKIIDTTACKLCLDAVLQA